MTPLNNVGCVPKSLPGTKVLKMTTTGDTIITLQTNGTFLYLEISSYIYKCGKCVINVIWYQ